MGSRTARIAATLLLGALLLTACASPSGSPDVAGSTLEGIPEPSRGPAGPAGTNPLPPLDVVDVATGREVSLGGLLPAERPLLVWFWAPH